LSTNKRIGLDTALLFLKSNSSPVKATSEELVTLVLRTAQGLINKPEIAEFFRQHVLPKP